MNFPNGMQDRGRGRPAKIFLFSVNPFLGYAFNNEALAKILEAVENRHSGQAKRDPESSFFEHFWIPAFAGMTE
jgi:hypothetical protein